MKNRTFIPGIDGSVKNTLAAHECMMLPARKKHWIRYRGFVHGTPHLLNSLRAEHSGSIVILIVLNMLTVH